MKKETLTLNFSNWNHDKQYTPEQIQDMIRQNIGQALWEWKGNKEIPVGRVLDAKLNKVDGNTVYMDLECRIDEEYVNPYVIMFPPEN